MPLSVLDWLLEPYPAIDSTEISLRAGATDQRIRDKPFAIELVRDKIELAPQTVRVEPDSLSTTEGTTSGRRGTRRYVVFGYKDHPSIADTDIQRGDRFLFDNLMLEVITVIDQLGERQAMAEGIG
jgi:hypothetical protein